MLRVRMRQGLLNRIKAIVEHDRALLHENWTMSDACREVLLAWVERREREIKIAEAAGFAGTPPLPSEYVDELILAVAKN